MILNAPFFISSALAPAIKIGDTTLSLLEVKSSGDRDNAVFELQGPDIDYIDSEMRSGHWGFKNTVEIFETFLSYMDACAESYPDGENADLFPPHVAAWCSEHRDDIGYARMDITDEDGNAMTTLIVEKL